MTGGIVVVGCGSIGQRHLGNLRRLHAGPLLAVDPMAERRTRAKEEHGAEAFERPEEALAKRPVAALICTPPHLHLAGARQAIEAGAHVFIEKPLSHTLEGVAELLEQARQRERLVCVGYNLRFHAGLRRLKELLDAGAIGRPLALQAEFGQYLPDWRPARDYRQGYNAHAAMGGSIILDASHELDYVRWLAGEVDRVFCVAGHVSRLEMDTEDLAAITLQMAQGVIAEVHLDCVQRGYSRRCKVIGEEGTLAWDLNAGVRWLAGQDKGWREFPMVPDPNDMYVEEMRHVLQCLRGECAPCVDGATGRRVLEIAVAACRSAATGQPVSVEPRAEMAVNVSEGTADHGL